MCKEGEEIMEFLLINNLGMSDDGMSFDTENDILDEELIDPNSVESERKNKDYNVWDMIWDLHLKP